jgi:hypothetical protein
MNNSLFTTLSLSLLLGACGDDTGATGSGGAGGAGGSTVTSGEGGAVTTGQGDGATTGQGGAATTGQGGGAAATPEATCQALCGKLVECGTFDTVEACTPGCTMAASDCSEADLATAGACVSEACADFPPCFEAVECIKT